MRRGQVSHEEQYWGARAGLVITLLHITRFFEVLNDKVFKYKSKIHTHAQCNANKFHVAQCSTNFEFFKLFLS